MSTTPRGPLSERELEVLDAIVERLIPSDESGPGAREAGVRWFIERALATDYAADADAYRAGLAALDAHALATRGAAFAELEAPEQDAVLRHIEANDLDGAAGFFELVRRHAVEGMFCDPAWGGNAGRVGWTLIGYPGPKAVWTEADQRLGPGT
jgi:gluconate 2-dehydrogenase gamma chain